MPETKKVRLVPYQMVSPGFEAVYTGEKSSPKSERVEIITTVISDEAGNEIKKWPIFTWTMPGQEKGWDDEVKCINNMQSKLGDLDDRSRQIRAHIASLVPCDSGFPVTVDELLNAVGRGELDEPSFRNGCWCPGMWWEQKTTQPLHMNTMRTVYAVITGYIAEKSRETLIKESPDAAGFISRAYEWLGPVSQLSEVQKLMMDRLLLTIDFFTKFSDTVPCSLLSDVSKVEQMEALAKELFEESGQGARLDMEISKKGNLPPIYPRWKPEYSEKLESLEDPRKKELYKTCSAIASGVYTLSDCHHNTFRFIENWIHGIGTGHSDIPTRRAGAERERLGRLLFGYVLGLDKWLSGVPMQFLLLDLGHKDLGFDPRNEILRVYAYLGEERTPVKEWLAASVWHNLMYSPIDAANPGGLIRHKVLLDCATQAGISLREWMDTKLQESTGSS